MRFLPLLLLPLLWAGRLPAQLLTAGVKAGVPLHGDLNTGFATSESKPYTLGPMVTIGLPAGLKLEVDALYRRIGYRSFSTDILGGTYAERNWGNSWEFPVVLRKSLFGGFYGGIGYDPRAIREAGHVDEAVVVNSLYYKTYQEISIAPSWSTTHGVVATAGIERRVGPLRFAPEVRYVYWTEPAFHVAGSHGYAVQSTRHQVELLIGVTF